MKLFCKLSDGARAKLGGLSLAALITLSYAGVQALIGGMAPDKEPMAWDLRDAPASGIVIRRPANSLTLPLGQGGFHRSEPAAAVAAAGERIKERGIGAEPRNLLGRLEDRGFGGKRIDDRPSDVDGGRGRGGLGGASRGLGSNGGARLSGGLSGSAGGASTSASLSVDKPRIGVGFFGEGAARMTAAADAVKQAVRKAVALLPGGAKQSALGASAPGQTVVRDLPGGSFTGGGTPISGQGSSATPAGPAGEASSPAMTASPNGAPLDSTRLALGSLPSVKDVRDITPKAAKDENGVGGGGDGADLSLPNTNLGRCVTHRARSNARCAGYTCAHEDAKELRDSVSSAYDSAAGGVKSMLQLVSPKLGEWNVFQAAQEAAVRGFRPACIGCEKIQACVDTAANRLFNSAAVFRFEKDYVDQIIRDPQPRPENRAAVAAWRDKVLLALSHEPAQLNDHLFTLIRDAETPPASCTQGIPAMITVPQSDGSSQEVEEPAGVAAKAAFLALANKLKEDQKALKEQLRGGWCDRHPCSITNLRTPRDLVLDHVDTLDVFADFLRTGEGGDTRKAQRALEQAQSLLANYAGNRSQNYIDAAFQLSEATRLLDSDVSAWQRAGIAACSQADDNQDLSLVFGRR